MQNRCKTEWNLICLICFLFCFLHLRNLTKRYSNRICILSYQNVKQEQNAKQVQMQNRFKTEGNFDWRFSLWNALWNTKGIWVSDMIWLAFCSPKSHGLSRENVKSELILFGDLACEMPFEIPRGIWVPEMIWLAFYSPKSHGMSRENVKSELILFGDLACEMPFEIPRGIWVPEMIWLAFCSPKSHGMSRENVKLELILIGLLFIQTPSNL